jgi:hypothetical protein
MLGEDAAKTGIAEVDALLGEPVQVDVDFGCAQFQVNRQRGERVRDSVPRSTGGREQRAELTVRLRDAGAVAEFLVDVGCRSSRSAVLNVTSSAVIRSPADRGPSAR